MLSTAKNRVRLFCVLIMLVVALLPGIPATAQDNRVDAVSAAATEVSRLEREGDLLLLHDRLQPDVRLVVSRAALAAWYGSPETMIPTAAPEILAVDFGSWTWPVTGQTYANVATVRLRQAGIRGDGVAVAQTEIQHFWFDGARWRWFFSADAAFIDALAQQVTPDATIGHFSDLDYARIDLVWSEIFGIAGRAYRPLAGVIPMTTFPQQTGCGYLTAEDEVAVVYCNADRAIYYLPEFRSLMVETFGAYAWPHIVSHEWGHHIQALLGIRSSLHPELDQGLYDIELELQADCLAGVYAQEAVARGWLTAVEVNGVDELNAFAADPPGTAFDDPGAHGTAQQRQQAFMTGLADGLFGCNVEIGPAA